LEKVWHKDSFSKRTRIPMSAIGWMMGLGAINLFFVEAILICHFSAKLPYIVRVAFNFCPLIYVRFYHANIYFSTYGDSTRLRIWLQK
jgi:hypothetical protein